MDNDPGSPFLEEKAFEELQQFWESLWQEKKGPFREVPVRRDPNPVGSVDVPETMEVLHLPNVFATEGDIMVRGDYAKALKDIEGYSTSKSRGIIVVGHHGIGRTVAEWLRWASMSTHISSALSRQDHLIVLYPSQTSSRATTDHPSNQPSIPLCLQCQRS